MSTENRPATERTALLVSQDTISEEINVNGHATVQQTVVNLMKTCMGTGCLALAYAAQQAGVVLFCVGLFGICVWNVYAVQRLIQCLQYIPTTATATTTSHTTVGYDKAWSSVSSDDDEDHDTHKGYNENDDNGSWEDLEESLQERIRRQARRRPPPPPGTSTLGTVAWYAFGAPGLQMLDAMMVILLLGIITAYFSAVITFLQDTPFTVNPLVDATVTAIIMATISLVPNIGFLSHASAIGLLVLLFTFLVIAGYGVVEYTAPTEPLPLWPESLQAVSRWFGCVVFGFGVAPLTYNFQSSMHEPERMVAATGTALLAVALSYMLAGVGLLALYPTLSGEVLHELPVRGVLPVITRLAMVTVVWMTAPLLIVPCGQLLEGKWQTDNRAAVRFGICGVAVLVAVALPSFVQVLSFVGCACVGMVSFCMPPLLHLRLSRHAANWNAIMLDGFMLAWGLTATIISTIYSV